VLYDNEGAFKAGETKLLTKALAVDVRMSAGYAPWCQGHVERWHSWLNTALSILCNKFKSNWREVLQEVLLAYRVSSHDSMDGLSPFEVHHGRRCRLPSDILTGIARRKDGETPTEYVQRQSLSLKKAFGWVREAQMKKALMNKARMDAGKEKVSFETGDQVLIFRPEVRLTQSERKAHSAVPRRYQMRWSKPKTVVRKVHENTYLVRDNGRGASKNKDRKVHVRHMLAYSPWTDDEEPMAVEDASESEVDNRAALKTKTNIGEMIVVAHESKEDPLIVGKVVTISNGECTFQRFGNPNNASSFEGALRPAWTDKNNILYFAKKPQHKSHPPYIGKASVRAVLQRGFALSKASKLPASVLKGASVLVGRS
jgi:hypothetical protein